MASVTLNHIFKRYDNKVTAVNDLNLEIRDKEFMVLVGPSGCGKTTALRMIAGLEEITDGDIRIGERVVNDVSPKDRDIAMVFQNYALYPHMSVYENMAFGLKLRKVPKADIQRRVGEAAKQLGIEALLERKPKALSGGQRQRVALGRAIVREPQVFLMDEPLSNLDAQLRVQTRSELIKLHRRLGVTTVYVTHDQVEAMTMGDRIAVMRGGVLQQCDTPLKLYAHPVNMFVAGFIGTPSMNFLPATLEKGNGGGYAINCGAFSIAAPAAQGGKLDAYVGKKVVLGVRPTDVFDKNLKNPIDAGPLNTVRTQVDVCEPMGDIITLYLTAGTHQIVAAIDAETEAADGHALDVIFDLDKTHLFDAAGVPTPQGSRRRRGSDAAGVPTPQGFRRRRGSDAAGFRRRRGSDAAGVPTPERSLGNAMTSYTYLFQDPARPADERIGDLLSRMTLKEKAACLGTDPSVPRLGVRGSGHVEGLHGLAMGEPGDWGKPLVIPTTTFPQAIGLAMTWDPETLRRVGAIEGHETRYVFQRSWHGRGGLVVRAPNADLGRDPRWGRTEECYGEDAFFNGTLAVALIQGLQGDHPTYWLSAALIKHFLANSNEDTRESSSSDMDERLYREYYSVPFRMGIVEGGSRAYMAAYNRVNGVPCAVHPMLKEITVAEWGQDGIICTDGGAMKLLVTAHKYYPDEAHAVAAVVQAGIGQFLDDYEEGAQQALAYGLLAESDVDSALRGVFRVMLKLGLLDPPELVPYTSIGAGEPPWLTEEHKLAVREATQKSVVLLKNDDNALPLDRNALKSVAVIGPLADRVLLDWYSGTPPYAVTPLAGIREAVGGGVTVNYADGSDPAEAARSAQASDVAIVCVGNHPTGGDNARWAQVSLPSEGREAVDRQSLTLEQEELVKRVHAANPRTIVALIASFPYAINWTQAHVPAIVHLTHNSQELGGALADVLFGDVNPGGRLVQTWPSSLDQLPPLLDYDIRHGRTYMYFPGTPLYPFGYGLSYTTFAYSQMKTSADTLAADGTLTVRVDVTNTGTRAGDEVAQLYVQHLGSAVERPLKELKGFQRVTLQPGETRTVEIALPASRLAFWDVARHAFTVEADTVRLMVGPSSAAVALETTIAVAQQVKENPPT